MVITGDCKCGRKGDILVKRYKVAVLIKGTMAWPAKLRN